MCHVGELSGANPPVPRLLFFLVRVRSRRALKRKFGTFSRHPPQPNLIIPMEADDSGSVRAALHIFGAVCGVLAAPARLLDAMPGNSEWVVNP